jgi:hypothetical protein
MQIQTTWQKKLSKFNQQLHWLEIPLVLTSLVWFIYLGATLENACITGVCRSHPLIQGNLYNTSIAYVIPVLAMVGLIRVAINYNITPSDNRKSQSFYLGIIFLLTGYINLAIFSKEFLYFNNKNEVQVDSVYLLVELGFLAIASAILLRDKKVWDLLTFFSKIRLFYYLLVIVIMVINLNLGVILFFILTPGIMYIDRFKQSHTNWQS